MITRVKVITALCLIVASGLSFTAGTAPATAAVRERRVTAQTQLTFGTDVRGVGVSFANGYRICMPLVNDHNYTGGINGTRWLNVTRRLPLGVATITSFSTWSCASGTAYASTTGTLDLSRHDRFTAYFDRPPKFNL